MICGRIEWCGDKPRVVHLTDNDVRKVQVNLEQRAGKHAFTLSVVIDDPEGFIQELQDALAWTEQAS